MFSCCFAAGCLVVVWMAWCCLAWFVVLVLRWTSCFALWLWYGSFGSCVWLGLVCCYEAGLWCGGALLLCCLVLLLAFVLRGLPMVFGWFYGLCEFVFSDFGGFGGFWYSTVLDLCLLLALGLVFVLLGCFVCWSCAVWLVWYMVRLRNLTFCLWVMVCYG